MSADWKQGKEAPPETLPYSEKKQNATLGHMILKENFFLQCKDRIEPGWFVNPFNQKLWGAMRAFMNKYKRAPRAEEIMESPSVTPEDMGTKNRLKAQINECMNDSLFIGLDVIHAELTEWLHAREYYKAIHDSVQLYNQQDLQGAIGKIRDASKNIETLKFSNDMEFDFGNYRAQFEADNKELEHALTFGVTAMDKLLNPEAKEGSLLKGDVTVLLAPVNVGKTTTLLTIGCTNAKRGKNVLVVTHEGRPHNISRMMWANLLSIPRLDKYILRDKLATMMANPEWNKIMDRMYEEVYKPHICYMPFNKAGMTVEDVTASIRRKQDEWAAKHNGNGFDLLIDDYPAKLTTAQASKGMLQRRHADNTVYDHFVQLSLELKFHSVVAIQANREGSKAHHHRRGFGAKDQGPTRLLTMEDTEESFGPMQTAANVISINRDATTKARNAVVFALLKSRTSDTGYAVVCGSRFDAGISHHDNLGATWYRGVGSHSDMVGDLLRQYQGKEIPFEALTAAG